MSVRLPGRTISIHAPRTGSDGACRWRLDSPAHFNPRSPHGERPRFTTARCAPCSFQSTLPARGATYSRDNHHCLGLISIHAPRTGSDRCRAVRKVGYLISIHAPRTGSDELGRHQQSIQRVYFNPRSPHGERPATDGRCTTIAKHFNPRSPHGERRIVLWMLFTLQKFQSTLPARGATAAKPIHDQMVVFQSTLPARGATCRSKKILLQRWIFQSTLPARGATAGGCNNPRLAHDFNPRSPHGERRFQIKQRASPRNFNPRSPHGERPR